MYYIRDAGQGQNSSIIVSLGNQKKKIKSILSYWFWSRFGVYCIQKITKIVLV